MVEIDFGNAKHFNHKQNYLCPADVVQVKLSAFVGSPVPLYRGYSGYSQSGRSAVGLSSKDVLIIFFGGVPVSTQDSSAENRSAAHGRPGFCTHPWLTLGKM